MTLQKKTLNGLYIVTPVLPVSHPQRWLAQIRDAVRAGAKVVQFRDKSNNDKYRLDIATELMALCREYHIPLIINDDIHLAKKIQADGVHIGADDVSLQFARSLLGDQAIIGVSCYNQLSIAKAACDHGADYVAFGRFFSSATKPDAVRADLQILSQAAQTISCPIIAIGGITVDNAPSLIREGAAAIAVVDAIFSAPNTYQAAHNFKNLF